MKKIPLLFFVLLTAAVVAQNPVKTGLVPEPLSCKWGQGHFLITPATVLYCDAAFEAAARVFTEAAALKSPKRYMGKQVSSASPSIYLVKQPQQKAGAYVLDIRPGKISIVAGDYAGAIHGIQSLRQLQLLQPDRQSIPVGKIEDAPRFGYRGLMLDLSRHFWSLSTVKHMVDMMALYKLNSLHLHLTDAAGWRIEIKKYPRLTRYAAWRTHERWKDWWQGNRHYVEEGEPAAYGGYYTQAEARELVAYARQRGITVIPEIEMPGHSEEVTAVFPGLACSGQPYTQGELCLGNDSTFIVLQDILKEVMAIFPSPYIHIGGDEAAKTAWKKCPKCQARIKAEGLTDEHGLQSYGIRRMEQFLAANGRKLLGWDEILEGGLAPGATVMSWRGESGGIQAAQAGHDVVMTPGGYCYFDAYQANPASQPEAIGGFLPLAKVYSYNPVPAALSTKEAQHVLGVQANVWAEYIPTVEHLEYMIFPRLLALSEVAWSAPARKNWPWFEQRLQDQYRLLQREQIHYYRPVPDLQLKASADVQRQASLVTITSEQYQPDIRYSTDGSAPDLTSPRYSNPFFVTDTTTVKAAVVLAQEGKMGPVASLTAAYHKAVGAKVLYNLPYSKGYPAQKEATLVNGEKGSFTYGDGQWQGFESGDMDVTIVLPDLTDVKKLAVSFMQITGPGVYMPEYVAFSWSVDGENFSAPLKVTNTVSPALSTLVIKSFETPVNNRAKYIRVFARNDKKGFLFADEIMVF